jgi:hypothetical protein
MGTDTKGPSLVSLVSHFSETHGDRYKRTVPLNLDKDIVQLQNTDPALAFSNEKIVKEAERKNLFDAFELCSLWLEKQLSE